MVHNRTGVLRSLGVVSVTLAQRNTDASVAFLQGLEVGGAGVAGIRKDRLECALNGLVYRD